MLKHLENTKLEFLWINKRGIELDAFVTFEADVHSHLLAGCLARSWQDHQYEIPSQD